MEAEDDPEIAEFLDDLKELGIGDLESPGVKEDRSIDKGKSSLDAPKESRQSSDSKECERVTSPVEELTPSEASLEEEWVLLEMFFGIPLFSEAANKAVCDKVCGT